MLDNYETLIRLLCAAIVGLLIGITRKHQPAGIRTFALIALGSAMFTLVGIQQGYAADPTSRILAQIISGVGFLGLGVIWKQGLAGKPHGLTTAAGIWVAAGLGMLIGLGMWFESAAGTLLVLLIMYSKRPLQEAHLEE